MAKRRRVDLAEIASLDDEIARAREQCEAQVQRACEKLLRRRAAGGSVHDLYLETLRSFYEEALAGERVGGFLWAPTDLQAFLGRHFPVYRDTEAFASVCMTLEATGARWSNAGEEVKIEIESFEELKKALRRDTATRMAERDVSPLEEPVGSCDAIRDAGDKRSEEELRLPRLVFHGKRRLSSHTTSSASAPHHASPVKSSQASFSASEVSQSDGSLLWLDDQDGEEEYSVPINSVVLPVEYSVEVVKKSQNWLGRWRTRYFFLRWNELEMRNKSGAPSSRHGSAHSFASQPMSTSGTRTSVTTSGQSASASIKSKRYSLENLISVQLIQLNESDPSRKQAIDLHFKQAAINGNGLTTKSLILASDKGVDVLKKIMSLISTFALFRAIVAGEPPEQMQRFIRSGANVNAFCDVPSHRLFGPMSPLQLALVQSSAKLDKSHELAVMKMLLDANADSRAILHWHFARRTLLLTDGQYAFEWLLPTAETALPALQLPLTVFGSDEHGWTLLMYLCLLGDKGRVVMLLDYVRAEVRETDKLLRFVEHVNGNGDTALHIAIKASGYQHKATDESESIALAIADCCLLDGASTPSTTSLFYISDANGQTVLHLAIKARMWRLVEVLLKHRLFDICSRDDFGNNFLHLLVKISAPFNIFESMVQNFKSRSPHVAADEHIDSRDHTFGASPLLLAVHRRREDYVEILLSASAGAESPSNTIEDGDASEVLHAAIRRGLSGASKTILKYVQRRGSPIHPSTLSLAIRFGLYRFALSIVQDEHIDLSSRDNDEWWRDPESGYPVVMLAAMSSQLELVALLADKGGEGNFLLQHNASGEMLLHALVLFTEHEHQDSKDQHGFETRGEKIQKEITESVDRTGPRTTISMVPGGFIVRVIEQLFAHTLVLLPSLEVLTRVCNRPITTSRTRERHALVNGDESSSGESYTLLHAVSASSEQSQLLPLLIAVARIRSSPPASLITACHGQDGENSIFVALRRGRFDKALLLLHHLLPSDSVQCEEDPQVDSHQWMEGTETTLMHLACQYPNHKVALMIIDLLLRTNECAALWDNEGWSPLHIAIRSGCDARIIQIFKKNDRDLNTWSDANYSLDITERAVTIPLSPLMVAFLHDNVVAFRELLRCGAEWRSTTPTYRVGLVHIAAQCSSTRREMIGEVLKLISNRRGMAKDAQGMSEADAAEILRKLFQQAEAPTEYPANGIRQQSTDDIVTDKRNADEPTRENDVLRITLLGLQTPERNPSADPTKILEPVDLSPPQSPSRSLSGEDSSRSCQAVSRSDHSRESSRERNPVPSQPRHPVLDDSTLEFLRDEEKGTLTLIAQEARTEAQEWLKKRSGKRKLLSEARAQLQAVQSHRRTGSGTVVVGDVPAPPVTDAQLLDTYKALAEKQFVDKHVAAAVANARFVIEKEKRTIYHETGVYPGEYLVSARTKDSSIGSNSARGASAINRSTSINGSITLLSSRSMNVSDPGNDSDRGITWWSDQGESSFDDDDGLGERPAALGTWQSNGSGGPVAAEGDDHVNPLDNDEFVHLIETRKSMH